MGGGGPRGGGPEGGLPIIPIIGIRVVVVEGPYGAAGPRAGDCFAPGDAHDVSPAVCITEFPAPAN